MEAGISQGMRKSSPTERLCPENSWRLSGFQKFDLHRTLRKKDKKFLKGRRACWND